MAFFFVPMIGLLTMTVSFCVPTTAGALMVSLFVVMVGSSSVSGVVWTSTFVGRLMTTSPLSVRLHAPSVARSGNERSEASRRHCGCPGLEYVEHKGNCRATSD